MKFEFEQPEDATKEPVAEVYKFAGGPELCLAVNTNSGKKVWFYPDGEIDIQGPNWGGDPIKKFYPGDSVTITF